MSSKKDFLLLIVTVLLIAGIIAMFVYDRNSAVLERTLDYDLPFSCEVVEMKKHGSLFSRSSYEAKIKISHENPDPMLNTIIEAYGVEGTLLSYHEFEDIKDKLFEDIDIVPEPEHETTLWMQNVETSDGHKITHFMCAESETEAYLYIYYTR